MSKVNCRICLRVWCDNGDDMFEIEEATIFIPELQTDDKIGSLENWYQESLQEKLEGFPESFFPDEQFETYKDPIIYEVIGEYRVVGERDYWGEYDEDWYFDIKEWTADFEEEYQILTKEDTSE